MVRQQRTLGSTRHARRARDTRRLITTASQRRHGWGLTSGTDSLSGNVLRRRGSSSSSSRIAG
eukprot:2651809-Rhodomonas_salina.2